MSETVAHKVIGEETIHCEACEQRIGNVLRHLRGVEDVKASSQTHQVQVTIDPALVSGNHFWFAWAEFKPDTRVWAP